MSPDVGDAHGAGCGGAVAIETGAWRSPGGSRRRHMDASLGPDGHPDLQGVWLNNSATPLERPKALEGGQLLTDAEVAELRRRAQSSVQRHECRFRRRRFGLSLRACRRRSLQELDGDRLDVRDDRAGVRNRTSLIVDPPDGRIPALTRKRRSGKRRADAIRAASSRRSRRAQPRRAMPDVRRAAVQRKQHRCRAPWLLPDRADAVVYHVVPRSGARSAHHHDGRPATCAAVGWANGREILEAGGRGRHSSSTRRTSRSETTSWDRPIICTSSNASRVWTPERIIRGSRLTTRGRGQAVDCSHPAEASALQPVRYTCHEGNYEVLRGMFAAARAKEGGR